MLKEKSRKGIQITQKRRWFSHLDWKKKNEPTNKMGKLVLKTFKKWQSQINKNWWQFILNNDTTWRKEKGEFLTEAESSPSKCCEMCPDTRSKACNYICFVGAVSTHTSAIDRITNKIFRTKHLKLLRRWIEASVFFTTNCMLNASNAKTMYEFYHFCMKKK